MFIQYNLYKIFLSLSILCLFAFVSTAEEMIFNGASRPLVMTLPKDESVISSRIESIVYEVLISEGDRVKAGRKAFVLDSKPFLLKKKILIKELASLRVKKKFFEKEHLRSSKLIQKSVVAQSVYDRTEYQLQQNDEMIKELENEINALDLDISFCHIAVPYDGTVVKVITHSYEFVSRGTPLFKIINDHEIRVVINLNEKLFDRVKVGQTATVKFRAKPEKVYDFKIVEIISEIEPETRTFKLYAEKNNQDLQLLSGMIGYCLKIE